MKKIQIGNKEMNRKFKFLFTGAICLLIFTSLFSTEKSLSSALVCKYNGGRFGDQLMCYYKAKLISYKYGIPLLYKPCLLLKEHYLDQLELSCKELPFDAHKNEFQKIVNLSCSDEIDRAAHVLYKVSLRAKLENFGITDSTKNDKNFLSIIKEMIKPIKPVSDVFRPKDKITVALHVRRGGGFDQSRADVHWPKKFPPDSFYIEQIKKISELVDHKALYIHVFTDDADPQHIIDGYTKALSDFDITFATRVSGNAHDKNVLEDFFAMSKFDCLIRPNSCFSQMAQIIGGHKIVIYPKEYRWDKNKLIIDSVWIDINGRRL